MGFEKANLSRVARKRREALVIFLGGGGLGVSSKLRAIFRGTFRPVHMILGQLVAPGQLTDPGVNFASVHGLTPVTVHMNFSLPLDNFERRVTRCTTPGNPPCRGNFSLCEQNAKVAPGQE